MSLPSRQQQPRARALTASATRLNDTETAYSKRLAQPWQLRALGYYDTIGEINFTSKFLARQISRVRYFPARRLPDGTVEPIESGAPVELLNQIQDPGGGQTQVLYDYGRLMFVTGEGVLFSYDEGRRWRFLWKDEVRKEPDGTFVRIDFEQRSTGEYGQAYRFWAPHPRWTDLADAPMRAVQDICEELLLLTLAVRSTALTRLTNGIFIMPQEASFGPSTVGLDEDPQQNPLLADWMEHVANQIENPGSAEARVPFLLEMALDYIPGATWLKTHDPATDYMEKDLRDEAIKRLALSLDMSPEDLLGYTDANHWTGRQVQLDRWRMFGYNKAELWASSVCDAYLRPALEREGEPWEDVIISFDDSQVVISPDRTEDALKAHNDGLINGKAAREALGWKESDQMTGQEKEEWLALKLRAPQALGDSFMPPERGPMPSTPNANGNAADGPPPPGTNTGVSRQESRTASILGAAELAVYRARELAGVRIRHKCPDCADGVQASLVASVVGPDATYDPLKLVRGSTDGLVELMVDRGIEKTQALALGTQLEVFAARTLFQPACPELPSGFVAAVAKAEEVSLAVAS